MADDWAPGDVAVCVDGDWGPWAPIFSPTEGSMYRVLDLAINTCPRHGPKALFLELREVGRGEYWCSAHFKKLRKGDELITQVVRKSMPKEKEREPELV
jgi:hypothetical protein